MYLDLRILVTIIWLGSIILVDRYLDEMIGIGTALWSLVITIGYLIFWIIYLIIANYSDRVTG